MSERFDDIIKKQLQGLESPVPQDMFDKIRNHPDVSDAMFDAGIQAALQPLESPVPKGQFDKISADNDLASASFDEAIRQRFATLETAVPADMWNRITERKRRRRPVAWWWMAASLLLLLGGGTWYSVQRAKQQDGSSNSIITNKKLTIEKENTLAGKNTSSRKSSSPNTLDTSETISHVQKENTDQEEKDVTSLSSDPLNKANPFNKNKKQKEVEKSVAVTDFQNIHRNSNNNKHSVDGTIVNRTAVDKEMPTVLNSGSSRNELQTDVFESTFNTVQLAMMQQLRSLTHLSPGQLLKAMPRSPVIPCPVNGDRGRNDWYADVYSSAFMVNKNIADKEAGKNAKSGFDSTLHRQVSFNAGISLVKNIGENILLKTGLQYNRLNESFRLTRINERKLVTTVSVRIVIIAPGDTVYIRDTSVIETIGTIQHRHQNTYKQWDVPLIIGYEFGGENVRLNANAGIIANIRSAYTGQILDTLQQIIDANHYNSKPVYKTNVGISLYAGLSILNPLGERTSLLIEPYARIGLGNTTMDNAWFRQKNSAVGISVGLRYKLNSGGQRR